MTAGLKPVYSAGRVKSCVARLGRQISKEHAGRTVDVVIMLENAFVFAADLVRQIQSPVVCHFVRPELRDVKPHLREVFFSHPPNLSGRNVLVVDAVLHSGVTQDFLLKRLLESKPHSLRMAVLVDKPQNRKVDLKPDYFGFVGASNYMVGYGLAGPRGQYRNLPCLAVARTSRTVSNRLRRGKAGHRAGPKR
ncbi:MAG: hypothetical protein L0387_22110 [Acidobacteria bacterium]|nr:hypothetical protein [Acidobacteriota bacterium]